MLRLELVSSTSTIFFRVRQITGQDVSGQVAYWHPALDLSLPDPEGGVVSFSADGSISNGELTLKPREATDADGRLSDEMLEETFRGVEPKGWGRQVVTMAWSWVNKHTLWTGKMVKSSWGSASDKPYEQSSKGARREGQAKGSIQVFKFRGRWISCGGCDVKLNVCHKVSLTHCTLVSLAYSH